MLLSQMNDKQRLITEKGVVVTKKKYVEEKNEYENQKIYTTKLSYVKVNLKELVIRELKNVGEDIYYKQAVDSILEDVREEDFTEIQHLLNKIIRKNKKYKVIIPDQEVEIDI
ncbi:hypothetical protein [Clostridium sp.]|uniref:hypothetical protein n=1 Tax=Clostridium sp. TaxID=1506 RepID=UPI001B7A14D1|nr:hypothetical protein [Clostridium sp.]MBP3916193.1 hypothetical protein [Clostridium sp.]